MQDTLQTEQIAKGDWQPTVLDRQGQIHYAGGEPVVDDNAEDGGIFNGTIKEVTINIDPDFQEHDPELVVRARYRKQ